MRILDLLERNDEFNSLYDDEVRVSGWRYAVDEEVSYALARCLRRQNPWITAGLSGSNASSPTKRAGRFIASARAHVTLASGVHLW